MPDVHTQITTDKRQQLTQLLRRLPAILAGSAPDELGIAAGFRARIGYAVLSLIAPNFEQLGRGLPGADGTKWPPLTKEYLAYQRRFGPTEIASLKRLSGLGKGNRHAPGGSKGLLTQDQLKHWRKIYADRLAFYIMKMSDEDAKARAAAIAWIEVKKMGAKTKLEVFGNRTVQILVDEGTLRGSLQPGVLVENGSKAEYQPPSGRGGQSQIFEHNQHQIIVGSSDKKAAFHHNAKSPRRRRRLWPEQFPDDWWRQILGTAVSGLSRIGDLFQPGGGI